MSHIYSVRDLTERLRATLEGAFPYVWVGGEVTNLARPSSGHVYFSLKDGEAQLQCVWFRGQQKAGEAFDPLTGEVFADGPKPSLARTLRDGQKIICAGRLTVYAARGHYQLLVDLAQESGMGQLHQEFERLKRALFERGWFNQDRKRPLPVNPARVAVITAPTGAAIHDFLRVAAERGTGASVRLYPALVQGAEAPGAIVAALHRALRDDWADVLVLIRGGGSLEDLWAFNDERVVEAVVQAGLPVLTGIGHEVDTSLADLAADVRAATPSHAAQLLWRERAAHMQALDELELRLQRLAVSRFDQLGTRLENLGRALHWFAPGPRLDRLAVAHGQLHSRLLRTMGPLRFASVQERLTRLDEALGLRMTSRLERLDRGLERQTLLLEQANPERPLDRGFALLHDAKGRLVRSIHALEPGQQVVLRLHDGTARAAIEQVEGV